MKPALLIIDLQKAYYGGEAKQSMDNACEYINPVLELFRRKELPVVWVQHINEYDGSEPGKEGFEFIDQLKPLETEHRVHKRYGNAFNKTDLLDFLTQSGVDTVILTGYCAENCVLSTCRGADDVDLTPILLRGAIASGNRSNLDFVQEINESITIGTLFKFMENVK